MRSMQIRLKLMGLLKEKTPEGGRLAVDDGATIDDVLAELDIPRESVHVFSVNGEIEKNKGRPLADEDELTVLPPVGGG